MSILNVEKVSHSFGGREILNDVSFRLLQGEHVALVGANGEGKSTFLNIITGKLTPEQGKIEWCKRITVGYLDQHTTLTKGKTIYGVLEEAFDHFFTLEKEMLQMYEEMSEADEACLDELMNEVGEVQEILEQGGFYIIDMKIQEIAGGLGLKDIGLDKDVSELSGGQRTKVLLAKLLLENPMILILDEPTNYLDQQHIVWLTQFLQNYENAFILVSHDTTFLNHVANVIYHVENTTLTRYKGDYDYFLQQHAILVRQRENAYLRQQKEIADLEDFIARNKARVATRNMAHSRQKKLDKMELLEKPKEKVKPVFQFMEARTPGKVIYKAENLVLGYDEPLTKELNFEIERNKKIAIKGVNGLGKSTLLKTLTGLIRGFKGEVEVDPYIELGYYAQEEPSQNHSALQEIWNEYPTKSNGEVRTMLAKCGLTTEQLETSMKALSGGEASKVRLCKILNRPCNVLVLDEPTNHLDVDAKEELARALQAFKGTVLLVSHDPEFYESWVDEIMNVEDWTVKII